MQAPTNGTIPFRHKSFSQGFEARTWYRVVGSLRKGVRPLIVLHGGPGYTHAYLKPTFDMIATTTSTPVVYYDQIGNGYSTHIREKRLDESFWTAQLFVDELDNLLKALQIDDFDLYGHSWGAMLAVKYVAQCHPRGLNKLILGSGPASMALWKEAARGFVSTLPPTLQERLKNPQTCCSEKEPEYVAAINALNTKTTLMEGPFPPELQESLEWLEKDDTVVLTTNGSDDLTPSGSLLDLDVSEDCHSISVPVLILSGDQDGATQTTIEPLVRGIPKVDWVLIEGGSHMVHLEKPHLYANYIIEFLQLS